MIKRKIGIVGLGLMGGSISIALKKADKDYIFIGLDHNKQHRDDALKLGLVHSFVSSIDELKVCDIIFLCIPVDSIISMADECISLPKNCTIIDLGSTKEVISNSIPLDIRENFVTAHPMTGTEKFGPKAAIDKLYEDKVVVLCDLEKSGKHQQKVACDIFTELRMNIVKMGAKEHDRHAAFISHMPHAISYALANSVLRQEASQSIVALAGGGFKDMSRIAKSSPNMWEDIFRQNKTNTIEAITTFQTELKKCLHMIEKEEWGELNEWMQNANTLHKIL